MDFLLQYGELDKIQSNFVWRDSNDEVHQIFDFSDLDSPSMQLAKFTEIMMPRGFSKTTGTNAMTLRDILFRDSNYIVYVSETATHAEAQLGNVQREIMENERIHEVFGNLRPAQREGQSWSAGKFETTTGIIVQARGRGQQIRGLNHRSQRPDKIILDDVEDSESVQTEEQRQKTREWFHGDVEQALPRMADGRILALGTLLHEEALLKTLEDDPKWNSIIFGAVDKQGDPLWPENMSHADIDVEKQSFAQKGMLHVFYKEFFNQIRNPETAKFKPEMISHRPVEISAENPEDNPLPYRAIAIDPAISNRPGADYTAIAVIGIHKEGWIHVIDMWGKRGASPREQVDKYFEFVKKYLWDKDGVSSRYGVEGVAYQQALEHLLREEMFRQKVYFEIEKVGGGVNNEPKDRRVEGILQPRYANGFILHQRKFPELETQLLDWPNGKKDFPDALSMAVSLLDDFAPAAAGGTGTLDQDEYPPLEEVVGGSWREA